MSNSKDNLFAQKMSVSDFAFDEKVVPVFNDMNLTPEQKNDVITYLKYLDETPSVGGFTLGSLGPVSEGLFVWLIGLGGLIAVAIWLTARSN